MAHVLFGHGEFVSHHPWEGLTDVTTAVPGGMLSKVDCASPKAAVDYSQYSEVVSLVKSGNLF